jgi:hypothetical protein
VSHPGDLSLEAVIFRSKIATTFLEFHNVLGEEREEKIGMRVIHLIPIALTLVALGGCASAPPRQTTTALTRAHTLVAAAEHSGAQQYAAADLQKAHDEAQEADQFATKDSQRADQLANEAAADAQLASARAQDAQARHALNDLHQTLQTLRSEEERNTGTQPAETTPGGPPPSNSSPPPSRTPTPLNSIPPQ